MAGWVATIIYRLDGRMHTIGTRFVYVSDIKRTIPHFRLSLASIRFSITNATIVTLPRHVGETGIGTHKINSFIGA